MSGSLWWFVILSMIIVFCHFSSQESTLKNSEKWRSPLFGATCNFSDQILPYGILFLPFINTDITRRFFYLCILTNPDVKCQG
jgi:hypothetical protein